MLSPLEETTKEAREFSFEIDGEKLDKDGFNSENIDDNIKTDSDIYNNADITGVGN